MDNLARDAALALAAGQTYGKWKAEHPHTRVDLCVEMDDVKRCDVCGKQLPGGHYRRRCSKECAKIASSKRLKERYKERKLNGQ